MNAAVPKRAFLRKVLLATDGSVASKPAEALACAVASAFEATLDVVAVLEFEPWRDLDYQVNQLYLEDRRREIHEQLRATAQEIGRRGIRVVCHEPVGLPSREIIVLAATLQTDLLVLGTHGRSGLDHLLIGSTAERVVRGAPCPVVTVRGATPDGESESPSRRPTERGAFTRLLVPIDFSDCSRDALEYAVQIGEPFGSAITLLHVVEPVAYGLDFTLSHALTGAALRTEIGQLMSNLVSAFEGRVLSAHHEIVPGLPADVIPRVAQARGSDAIVMGTHGRSGWSHIRFGSVAESVVRRAHCPVFTVRSPKYHPLSPEHASTCGEPSATKSKG